MRRPDAGDAAILVFILTMLALAGALVIGTIDYGFKSGDCRRRGFSDYDADAGACYSRIYEPVKR